MTSLGVLIAAAVPGVVESDVFGTTHPAEIASMLAALVEKAIGVEVSDGIWYQSSVAAVAGLRLDDGRMVVVHAYRHDVTPGSSTESCASRAISPKSDSRAPAR